MISLLLFDGFCLLRDKSKGTLVYLVLIPLCSSAALLTCTQAEQVVSNPLSPRVPRSRLPAPSQAYGLTLRMPSVVLLLDNFTVKVSIWLTSVKHTRKK